MLQGTLVEMDALRHTPGGVPVLRFRLAHESSQREGGVERRVDCEVNAIAFEAEAKLLASAPLGSSMTVTGFLDRKGKSAHQLVLHATRIEFH